MENLVGKNGQVRAAIYVRVSTGDQNCDRQEADLLAYADRCGYRVRKIFRETGSGVKLDRVERGRIMALARSRQIDIILVTELTRWGRSTIDLLDSLGQLQSWGISSPRQNDCFDHGDPRRI